MSSHPHEPTSTGNDPSQALRDLALGDLELEMGRTRQFLAVIPEDELDFRPHERSMSLGELGTHLTELLAWMVPILNRPEFDLATVPDRREPVASRGALLARFDELAASLRGAFGRMTDDALTQEWTLRRGEKEVAKGPRAQMIRTMGISHMVHHRGQIGVYLRLLDVPLPATYGPTADHKG